MHKITHKFTVYNILDHLHNLSMLENIFDTNKFLKIYIN